MVSTTAAAAVRAAVVGHDQEAKERERAESEPAESLASDYGSHQQWGEQERGNLIAYAPEAQVLVWTKRRDGSPLGSRREHDGVHDQNSDH